MEREILYKQHTLSRFIYNTPSGISYYMQKERGIQPVIKSRFAYYKYSDLKREFSNFHRLRFKTRDKLLLFFKYAGTNPEYLRKNYGIEYIVLNESQSLQFEQQQETEELEIKDEDSLLREKVDLKIESIENQIRELQDKLDKL